MADLSRMTLTRRHSAGHVPQPLTRRTPDVGVLILRPLKHLGYDGVRRRGGVGQGRGAVLDHRARRVRSGRHGADARYRKTAGEPDRADQGDRRR